MNTSSIVKWVRWGFMSGLVLGSLATAPTSGKLAAQDRTGEYIYRQQCASCHGARGEGTQENYPRVLTGDRSVAKLVRVISRTMPKDDPGTCVGEDAQKVAQYIYDTFYSPAARARTKPPRLELSRLTVRQFRNAVADLIGSFRVPKGYAANPGASFSRLGRHTVVDFIACFNDPTRWDPRSGLQGEYYKLTFQNSDHVFERIDPGVCFDFQKSSPDPKNKRFKDSQFSIRWRGSVLAPETGWYEFIVRKEPEHGARLWVNRFDRPLIDAWLRSGTNTEHRESVFLVGGRLYPLQLEFSKALSLDFANNITGNDKAKPSQASIRLEWKPPHHVAEIIPQRQLRPYRSPEVYAVATPFPPDDRNAGYERGTSISKAWDEAVTTAAIEAAAYVIAHLREFTGVSLDAADARPRVRDFCLRFAERAFRQPLTASQKQRYVDRQFAATPDLEMSVKRVVLLVLKSPRFLYREIGRQDAYAVASRLSFGLWDSLPDPELLQRAAAGQLTTRAQVSRQAERMVNDLRTRAKLHEFFLQWLKVDQVRDLVKDRQMFPGFDQAAFSDLRTSLELFLDEVAWSESSDFCQLLLSDSLYLNGRLARLYDAGLSPEAPFQKVVLKSGEHAGVLSHPYLMATFAHPTVSSPILRGVFLTRHMLGRSLPPPPEAVTLQSENLHPQLTTRQRVVLQTRPQACISCHGMINPLGFTLENFDAVGRFRKQEKERPIDATGSYETRTGREVKFSGVRDLARFLAQSEEAQEAFVEQLFHNFVKQPIRAFGQEKVGDLRRSFAANHYSIRRLLVAIMAESTLTARQEKCRTPASKQAGAVLP